MTTLQAIFFIGLPLALFVLLVVVFVLVLRRAARVMAANRELDAFRHQVQEISTRSSASLGGAGERIDAVRRGAVAPDTISDALAEAVAAVGVYRSEAEALAVPPGFARIRGRLLEELERADRALEMVAHGCDAMDGSAGRPHQSEGQTAVKRGYLNLLHAREAIVDVAGELRARPPQPDGRRYFSDRPPID